MVEPSCLTLTSTPSMAPSCADDTVPLSATVCACAPITAMINAAKLTPAVNPIVLERIPSSLWRKTDRSGGPGAAQSGPGYSRVSGAAASRWPSGPLRSSPRSAMACKHFRELERRPDAQAVQRRHLPLKGGGDERSEAGGGLALAG